MSQTTPYIVLRPDASHSLTDVELSPESKFLAVGGRNKSLQIFQNDENNWRHCISVTEEALNRVMTAPMAPYSSICAILWHPIIPRNLLVAYSGGLIVVFSFEEHGSIRFKHEINLGQYSLIGHNIAHLKLLTISDDGKEISGILNDRIITYGDPWATEFERISVYRNVIPDRLIISAQDALGCWYLHEGVLLLLYPSAIFAVTTWFPHQLLWEISLERSRNMTSGAISPDKSVFISVTEYGEAELYSLTTHEFLAKVSHGTGPFRSIGSVVFFDRTSVALIRKNPNSARGNRVYADIIPRLAIGSGNPSFELQLATSQDMYGYDRFPDDPVFAGGIVSGKGHLVFVKDILSNVAMVCLEDLTVTGGRAVIGATHEVVHPPSIVIDSGTEDSDEEDGRSTRATVESANSQGADLEDDSEIQHEDTADNNIPATPPSASGRGPTDENQVQDVIVGGQLHQENLIRSPAELEPSSELALEHPINAIEFGPGEVPMSVHYSCTFICFLVVVNTAIYSLIRIAIDLVLKYYVSGF